MATATSAATPYQTVIEVDHHSLLSDTSWQDKGGDSGPKPSQLLDASLASCIAMTVRIAADARGVALEQVIVEVTHTAEVDHTDFHCSLTLIGDLTEKQRAGLHRVAHRCPVSKALQNTVNIGIELR